MEKVCFRSALSYPSPFRNNKDKMFKALMTNNRVQDRYDKKIFKIQQEHDLSENKFIRKTRELQRKIDTAVKKVAKPKLKYEKGYDYGYRLPENQNWRQEIFNILKPKAQQQHVRERRENTYFQITEQFIGGHSKPKADDKIIHHEPQAKKTSFKELFDISK